MKNSAFTLIEVLIIVAILGLLMAVIYFFSLPQLARGRDGRRLSDLSKLKTVFEDYYNDHSCYPPRSVFEDYCGGGGSTVLDPYIKEVPCDPKTGGPYQYLLVAAEDALTPDCPTRGYRLLTDLEQERSQASAQVGCDGEEGCGVTENGVTYDYGVAQGIAVNGGGDVLGSEIEERGGGDRGEEGGLPEATDWCCVLQNNSCTAIVNGVPSQCDRDYHGINSRQACVANCI